MNALTKIEAATPATSTMSIGRFVADSRWHGELSEIDVDRVLGYSIVRHRNIKTFKQLDDAEAHNDRDIETPNARDDAPEPVELLTWREGSFRERAEWVRGYYNAPEKPQKHGNLAWEDVFTASPEYWNRNGADWKKQPVEEILADPLIKLAFKYAQWKYHLRLISVKVHLDEETPHIHVVALALVHGLHKVRGRKPSNSPLDAEGNKIDLREPEWKWTYYGSKVRGSPWQLARNHDDWNNFVKHLGLLRGSDGTKMGSAERRARNKGYTGRASKVVADAKKAAESMIAEARQEAETIRQKATADASTALDTLAKAERDAEALLQSARSEAEIVQTRTIKEAEENAKALTTKMNQKATEVILHAATTAKELTDKAADEAAKVAADAIQAAEAVKTSAEIEGRSILDAARTQASEAVEKVRREAAEQAEAEAQTIRETAERDAARIRQAAESERQRHLTWLASENARLEQEKEEVKKAKAAAEAAKAAVDARQDTLAEGEADLARRETRVGERESACTGRETDLRDAIIHLNGQRAWLDKELTNTHRLAKEMQEHYREFVQLKSDAGKKAMPPEVAKAGEWLKSQDAKDLKEALDAKRRYDEWQAAQMGR